MKSFVLHEYTLDILTKQVSAKYSFSMDDERKHFETTYPNLQAAQSQLRQAAKDWVLGALDQYVNHKKHIIEAYNSKLQNDALKAIKTVLTSFHAPGVSLQTICQRFLNGIEYFKIILPSESNPSFLSSRENLEQITLFCNTFSNFNFQ